MEKYLYKLSSIDKLKGVTPDVIKYEVHINMSREKYASRKGLIILFDTIDEALEFYDKLSNEGAGIIFIGYTTISDYDQYDDSGVFRIDKDEHIEEYKKLVSIISFLSFTI